jgi:hypothetical protein
MHYILIVLVICVIIIWQIRVFGLNQTKRKVFSRVFPGQSDAYHLKQKEAIQRIESADDIELLQMLSVAGFNVDTYIKDNVDHNGELIQTKARNDLKKRLAKSDISGITTTYSNPILTVIIDNINSYLFNNKNAVSDFHLMKDIVDRNCDAIEEEIDSQIPVPLYFGLMGTMVGILVGIGYLVFSGDLGKLLGAGVESGGAEGVNALMAGVALAMISSIVGIFLTTIGSTKAKNAKAEHEKNKNIFLSWIQAELLPELTSSTSSVLEKVTQNLSDFNQTFSENVAGLRETFGMIDNSYSDMSAMLSEVNKLRIADIANANIEVYQQLKGCTKEIGQFSSYLHSVNDYVRDVRALTEKIDDAQERTKAIETMGEFFRSEIQQIELRKGAINKAVGSVDEVLLDAITKLRENSDTQLTELAKVTVKQQQMLEQYLEETTKIASDAALQQQQELEQRLEETARIASEFASQQQQAIEQRFEETALIVAELKNLPDVKEFISKLEQSTSQQNRNLEQLISKIGKWADNKATEVYSDHHSVAPQFAMPQWAKAMLIVCGSLIAIASLSYLVPQLIQWFR